jgi:hypothetical protein
MAVYRLTVLIVRDLGPYRIFARLRSIDRCSKLLKCVFCTSLWLSAGVNLLYYFTLEQSPKVMVAMSVLAMSGIAIMLDRTFTADYSPK